MKRNKFSLSHRKLFSCDAGELIPCGLVEVLPGDSFQQSTSLLVRASPMLAPVMHPVEVRIHHWFVPFRLIWDEFEDFITGGSDGMDATQAPQTNVVTAETAVGTLADYLGIPPVNNRDISVLPFRAYGLIWNEWYRDQDLETPVVVSTASGPDSTTNMLLQNCAWEKDYFTSSRPWEQKGPSITIPLGTTAPVVSDGTTIQLSDQGGAGVNDSDVQYDTDTYPRLKTTPALTNNVDTMFGANTGLETDLTGASAITINLLREALALQRFEEARARFGSRYVEYLRYLGVRSSDARLQRPEYLGGGKQVLQFSEVLQTAEGTNPVGEMRGHGIGSMRSNRYRRFFEEHGYVMSLFSVRPKTIYMQGAARLWHRTVKEDYWQKELEHIGQQEVYNREIYFTGTGFNDVFGYQDRYDEYRRQESTVSGEFRNSTLNFWHMAREFGSAPALNASFVKCVPTERTFAVPSEDVYYVLARHSIQARRGLSQTGRSYTF